MFSEVFAEPESAVHARILAEVLGDEYPAELAPYSFTSRSELAQIAREVSLAPGELLLDVGCGRGGSGLWVAAAAGARYLGVDIASSALAAVHDRAGGIGMAGRVRTAAGTFGNLPLGGGVAGAVMSIDALLFAPDKEAALLEVSRALRPTRRLVTTTWDYSR